MNSLVIAVVRLSRVEVKNKFLVGDSLEMMTPKVNIVFKLEVMENRKSQPVETQKVTVTLSLFQSLLILI
ncbi:U32 family peptidase C-terminal domain-containing protein [Vibrio lentus]|nr:U32 family peptidase C-terminal domain-containing protein [Vibrio lentus]